MLDEPAFAQDAVAWPTGLSGTDSGRATAKAFRAKLKRSSRAGRRSARFPFDHEPSALGAFGRAARGLLLVAVAAVLAGSTYLAYQVYVQPAPADTPPALTEPGAPPGDLKSDRADPTGRRIDAGGAG
jgi:hypothetical protein